MERKKSSTKTKTTKMEKEKKEMIKATLILYAHLSRYVGTRSLDVQVPEGEKMSTILKRWKIPLSEVVYFSVDCHRHDANYQPKDGDIIELIPSVING